MSFMRKKEIHQQRTVNPSPRRAKCPVCSKQISGGFAYFSFGAVIDLLVLQKKGLNDTIMEAFCDVGYHGSDPEVTDSANYCVADSVKGGQVDLYFCSLACLRNWFCGIVDDLERQTVPQQGGKPKRRRPPAEPHG